MVSFELDYAIEKILLDQPTREQVFFREMFGAKIARRDAESYFNRILTHKWYVSERLGRDIGLPVAALDFVANIEPLPVRRKTGKRTTNLHQAMKFGLTA